MHFKKLYIKLSRAGTITATFSRDLPKSIKKNEITKVYLNETPLFFRNRYRYFLHQVTSDYLISTKRQISGSQILVLTKHTSAKYSELQSFNDDLKS